MCGLLLSRPPARNELINDQNGHICAFWEAMRDRHGELKHKIAHTPHCRRTYTTAFARLHAGDYGDLVDRAWLTYVCLQHSMLHGLGTRGWGAQLCQGRDRHQTNGTFTAHRTDAIHARMIGVQIENTDAVALLDRLANIAHATMYCDPPYQHCSTHVYGAFDFDRTAFLATLQRQTGRVAISGYGNEWDALIDAGWTKHTLPMKFNHVGINSKKPSGDRTETLWCNYPMPNEQLTMF